MKKPFIILGHLSFLITAILAIVFYKERVLYVDSGQQIFEMINNGGFSILLYRYSMYVSEVFPWLAIQCGLPLKYILLTYSLSFILIYYVCFLLCIYRFKNLAAGMTIALAPLVIRLAFGQSLCEPWMGIAYSALFYALLNDYNNWKKKGFKSVVLFYSILLLVVALNYFIHPITLFTMAFAVGFTYFNHRLYKQPYIYWSFAFILLAYAYKYFSPHHPYEDSFFDGLKNAAALITSFNHLPIIGFLKLHFFTNYAGLLILWVITSLVCLKTKKRSLLIFSTLFIFSYILLVTFAFYKGDAPFMLESRLIPLGFMVILPAAELLKDQKTNVVFFFISSLMLTFSFINLTNQVRMIHSKRINSYKILLAASEKYPGTKFFVKQPLNRLTPFNSWGASTEILLLSSIEGKEYSKTIIFVTDEMHIEDGINNYPCIFLGLPWRLYINEENLNKKYFNLNCSTYQELPYPTQL